MNMIRSKNKKHSKKNNRSRSSNLLKNKKYSKRKRNNKTINDGNFNIVKKTPSKRKRSNNANILNILKNKYVLYTKIGCPYCVDAKELLLSRGLRFIAKDYKDLDDNEKTRIIEKIKIYNNGEDYKYFPKIFRNNEFIGGFDKLCKILN